MNTPELITEPPALDVECSGCDLQRVIQEHADQGYRPAALTVKGTSGYSIAFYRIKPSPARVVTTTGGQEE